MSEIGISSRLPPRTPLEQETVGPSPTGVLPTPSDIDPALVQEAIERSNPTEVIAEGAAELIAQEEEPSRGVPVTSSEAPNLRHNYREKGQARIRALTEVFGEDALVLGHLLFQVPPLAIRIKKGNITYRWKPLRTNESIAVKSGNGECYIEIDLVFVGLSQIQNSLSELIALWKKIPFCFIENVHIRKMMIPNNPEESMAVCLETLVMDAVSGRPNTVYATLITKWFNYKPYSHNFWFRKEWEPAENFRPRRQETGDGGPVARIGSEGSSEGGTETPPSDPGRTILVDLSAIQDSNVLSYMARDLPPEVGLLESNQITNPGDPTIDGTYPVVYPFNSTPFLHRVRTGNDAPVRIRSWSDGIKMQWNSFIRMNVPRSWQYTIDQEPQVSVSAERPRNRDTEGTSRVPPAVTGERDTILFLGDSIMVGFLALGGRSECKMPRSSSADEDHGASRTGGPPFSTPTFFEWSGNSRFPSTSGFRYIAMCRVGASSQVIRNWWNAKKNDAALKAPGNNTPCSRVAGVLIHCGTNDGTSGPNLSALRTIVREASEYGAIPMVCALPPSNDADHLTPPKQGQLKLWFGSSAFQSYQNNLPDYHQSLVGLTTEVGNGIFIDYHEVMVEPRFRGNRAPPLAAQYQASVPGQPNYYNIHWNAAGYTAGGNYIHGSMPWNSLGGITPPREPESNLWRVCYVEDGDTVWVWGNHPDSGQRVVRNIRMQYIDTPETYGEFRDSRYNSTGEAPMPDGQDSYRPTAARYGTIAKNALRAQLPEGTQVDIRWGGTGYYGRYLGVIFKGRLNLNLWMVEQGHAFSMLPSNPSSELGEHEVGFEYWRAEQIAKGQWPRDNPSNGPRGVWNQREVILEGVPDGFPAEVRANLVRLMRPGDYRTVYASASDGGHGGIPSACSEATAGAELDEGADVGGSDADRDA